MLVEAVDPSDKDDFRRFYEPFHASEQAEWPDEPGWSLEELRVRARPSSASMLFLSVAVERPRSGGAERVLGSACLTLPTRDNLETAELSSLTVHPEHRRRGAGTVLLGHAEELARRRGRREVIATTDEQVDRPRPSPAERFAEARGYSPALRQARRRLALPADPARLDRLSSLAAASTHRYAVVTWTGPCPEHLLAGRLALGRAISTDAPHGELDLEEERWDSTRLREFEATQDEMGRERYSAGAVETSTGELVGVSELGLPRGLPAIAYQFDTVVLSSHRGHRLGLALKVAALRALTSASPATRAVLTWNAADNGPMIAVNEALGFELVGLGTVFSRRLEAGEGSRGAAPVAPTPAG